ncbi:MAG TPA: hypothetical protein PK080_06870, partial [Hyphomonadaceae bacterium]|nr:hypothetical protein [Hyphomonadaceae bacterium]
PRTERAYARTGMGPRVGMAGDIGGFRKPRKPNYMERFVPISALVLLLIIPPNQAAAAGRT